MNLNNKIVKRDGRLDDFDGTKIEKAILKAFIAVDGDISDYAIQKAKNIAEFIETQNQDTALTVEQIQDLVEKGLMNTRRKDVARAFITYRNERTLERERNSDLIKTIWKKIMASDVQNQNANVDEYSFGGRMGESNSAMMRKLALDYCMSDMARNNHLNNEIYTHDLDHYVVGDHNCLTIPYDHLLKNGFNTRQTDIRPAKSIGTAFQLIAVIAQIQSLCQFGGVAASHLDWTMVPYVRMSFTKHFYDGLKYIEKLSEYKLDRFLKYIKKDLHKDSTIHFSDVEEIKQFHEDAWQYAMDLTIKETSQAVEGMYHNLNSLQSRSGEKYIDCPCSSKIGEF